MDKFPFNKPSFINPSNLRKNTFSSDSIDSIDDY